MKFAGVVRPTTEKKLAIFQVLSKKNYQPAISHLAQPNKAFGSG